MAHNSLAPGFVKLYYTFTGIQHSQTLPVIEDGTATPGSMPNFTVKTGSPITMAVAVDAYVVVLKALLGAAVDINSAEYWRQPLPTDDPVWIYTHLIGVIGTNSTASLPMLQMVFSFRTAAGGLYKNYIMEQSGQYAANARETYPFAAGSLSTYSNYLIGASSWVFGRDGAELVVPINRTTKYNDALRKRRLLL